MLVDIIGSFFAQNSKSMVYYMQDKFSSLHKERLWDKYIFPMKHRRYKSVGIHHKTLFVDSKNMVARNLYKYFPCIKREFKENMYIFE